MKTYEEMAKSALDRIRIRKNTANVRIKNALKMVPAALLLTAVLGLTAYYGLKEDTGTIEVDLDPSAGTNGYAVIGDYCETFQELESTAGFIVRARALSSEKRIGIVSEMETLEAYKGEAPHNFRLYQLANCNPVQIGGEYILFLNLQNDGAVDEFYPVSAGSGVMKLDNASKTVYIDAEKLIGPELIEWLREYADGYEPVYSHYDGF